MDSQAREETPSPSEEDQTEENPKKESGRTVASGGYSLEGEFSASGGFYLRCGNCGHRQKVSLKQRVVTCSSCNTSHTMHESPPRLGKEEIVEPTEAVDKYANFKICRCGWVDDRVLDLPPVYFDTVVDAFQEWSDTSTDIAHHHQSIGWKWPLKELPREHPSNCLTKLISRAVPFDTPSRRIDGVVVVFDPHSLDNWYEKYREGLSRLRMFCEHSKMPNLSWASTHPLEGEGYLEFLPPRPDGLYAIASIPDTAHGHHILKDPRSPLSSLQSSTELTDIAVGDNREEWS